MGTSTFCAWGTEHDNPVSHARCRTEDCECECHHEHTSVVEDAAEELRAVINRVPEPKRPARRTYTDADKLRIIAAYIAAPRGTKGTVLARHGVTRTMVERWAKKNRLSLTRAVTVPMTVPLVVPPVPVIDVDAVVAESADDDTDELVVALDPGDRDILDALAFLTDLPGGAATLVADLVNDVVTTGAAAQDVQQLLTARRARQERTVG